MEVHVQIERRSEELNDGDRSALARANSEVLASAPALRQENRTQKGCQQRGGEPTVIGKAVAKRERKRKYPLLRRHRGSYAETAERILAIVPHAANAWRVSMT